VALVPTRACNAARRIRRVDEDGAALLGHSDLETTLNVYTHALPASQRRAVERVSEVMFSIVLELGENEKEGKSN